MRQGGLAGVFLDRDGTLMEDADYPSRPEDVRLLPDVAPVLTELGAAGVPLVVVTNQSGIARGMLSQEDYERVHERLVELLAAEGATLTAAYHCPHHPDFTGPCDCRKPGTGLFRRAAEALDMDVKESLFVGDRWRDVAPGIELGGTALLVPSTATPAEDRERAGREGVLETSLRSAVERWRQRSGRRSVIEQTHSNPER